MLSEPSNTFKVFSRDVMIKSAGVTERTQFLQRTSQHLHTQTHGTDSRDTSTCSNWPSTIKARLFVSVSLSRSHLSANLSHALVVSRQIVDMVLVNWYGAQWCDNNLKLYCVETRSKCNSLKSKSMAGYWRRRREKVSAVASFELYLYQPSFSLKAYNHSSDDDDDDWIEHSAKNLYFILRVKREKKNIAIVIAVAESNIWKWDSIWFELFNIYTIYI